MKVKLARAGKRRIQTIEIKGEFIRLDALLKFSGITMTGGEAKQLILESRVTVDGEICTQRGKKIHPGNSVGFMQTVLKIMASEKPQDSADQTEV